MVKTNIEELNLQAKKSSEEIQEKASLLVNR